MRLSNLAPSPIVYQHYLPEEGGPLSASLWEIPSECLDVEGAVPSKISPSLKKLADLEHKSAKTHGIFWSTDGKEAVSMHNDCIRSWAVDGAGGKYLQVSLIWQKFFNCT